MGGMIAQHVALTAPERVDRLVLISTTSGYPSAAQAMWAERIETVRKRGLEFLVEPTLERWFTPAFRAGHPEVVARIAALIRATPLAGYIGSCRAIATMATTDRLSALRCRTLVIAGADDAGTPPSMGQTIAERIPGARFELLRPAAHLCNIEQAAWTGQLLQQFLTEEQS
jgi:3-oxoadipate enol-lactonase